MPEAIFDLRRHLELIGEQTRIHLQDRIKSGSFASGELHGSLRSEVTEHDKGLTLAVYAAETFFYVEHGRRPGGKLPPAEPIKAWIQAKGIDPEALWPVRASIAKKGIKPRHYLRTWIEAKEPSWQKLLGDAAVIDLTARFRETFAHLTPKAA